MIEPEAEPAAARRRRRRRRRRAARRRRRGSRAAARPPISIDEFARIDLRVAQIVAADSMPGADKLLKLQVDLGECGERQIFAGIRAAYEPAALVGRLTVVVANLEPRKMRFGISQGMVLAAGPGGKDLFLLVAGCRRQPRHARQVT